MSRDEMVTAAAEAIGDELDNRNHYEYYGDAVGHLGGEGIRGLAAAAVDAVLDAMSP